MENQYGKFQNPTYHYSLNDVKNPMHEKIHRCSSDILKCYKMIKYLFILVVKLVAFLFIGKQLENGLSSFIFKSFFFYKTSLSELCELSCVLVVCKTSVGEC